MYSGLVRSVAFALLALSVSHRVSAELTDPMRPPDYRSADVVQRDAPARTHFRLTSTLIAPQRRVAVINGQRVGVGGRVGGARVVEITPSEVKLRLRGRTYTVRMLSLGVKRPAAGGSD